MSEPETSPSIKSTAEQRGMEMMLIPIRDLPELAKGYAKRLCDKVGMCGETLLTAWIVYAQIVEKLPCTDSLYFPTLDAVMWYSGQGVDVSHINHKSPFD